MGEKILGAVLAGGQSRRFGSDKALADIDGQPMLDCVVAALTPQVEMVVICGREWPGLVSLADRPSGGAGPLAGLNAALHHAAGVGYAGVLAVPMDVLPLPADLRERLAGQGAAVFTRQHAIGYWPMHLAELLDSYLADGHRRIDGWINLVGARRVEEPFPMRNINRPEDLA
jgi:molybdopterin-guanine dinucleotide biosynthesis protein A